MKFKNYLKKAAIISTLILAEALNNNYNSGGYPTTPEGNLEKYKAYEKSKLEETLRKEEESLKANGFYLTPDSLNKVIKDAYGNVKKWPEEFDKRLYRLLIKQESGYNIYAVSKTGYKGLGQIGSEVMETFRPEEFAKIKNPNTGSIDTLALEKYLFNPINNLELSLENLDFISRFCAKYDKNWENSDLETKRKKILFAYNAGVGTAKYYEFNPNNPNKKKLPKENREYAEKIMEAYHNPNIKVKL